jgi:hypothetical protein
VQAETRLADAETAARKACDEYDIFATRMREELAVFQAERSQDMTRALRDFALAQAKLAKQSSRHWRELVDKMRPVVEGMHGEGAQA